VETEDYGIDFEESCSEAAANKQIEHDKQAEN
jgi:hypothetical protein